MHTLIFDLDNTLYAESTRLFDQIDVRMTDYVATHLKMPHHAAKALQHDYYQQQGTTLAGLMQHHNVCPLHFMDYVHDIDYAQLPENPKLKQQLESIPNRKVIYTNASTKHAQRTLERLKISHCFDGIFDVHAANYNGKPSTGGYHAMLAHFAINPEKAVMLDDLPQNLEAPAAAGTHTVHIGASSITRPYIHTACLRVEDWLASFLKTCGEYTEHK